MSVNGLDAPSVKEAWDAALLEAGGWFLLRYTSRDDVELYARGNGGLADFQSALAKYPEKSPLYGFLIYRRRKIILKYLPEGTSRLLQARTTVHFQGVTDYFSPHDSTFDASSPDQLSDASLSSICKLHPASSSSSLRSSARKQQLDGISEAVEPSQSSKPDVSSILARIQEDKHSGTPESQHAEIKIEMEDKNDDADSIDELLDVRGRKNRSLDLHEALALGPEDVSGSEDSAVHSLGGRRSTTVDGTAINGHSQAYVPEGWQPKKRRLFTRSVEEAAAEDARERAKLPAGIHIRRAEEEAAKAAEEAKTPKSPKRPKSSKRRSSRSSKPRPMTSELNHASKTHAGEGVNDLRSAGEVPLEANTSSSGTALQAGQTLGPVHDSQHISAADDAQPLKTTADPPSAVNANGNAVQSKKASTMTPERQRLMKALQLRNKQHPSTKPAPSAPEAGSVVAQSSTFGSVSDPQQAQTTATSMRPAAQALLGPTSSGDHPMAEAEANARRGRLSVEYTEPPSVAHNSTSVTADSRQAHTAAGADASGYFSTIPAATSSDTRRKSKRRTLPRPIDTSAGKVDLSDVSPTSSFSDDLQTATVHEAMRVAIPQTPMTPTISEARATPRSEVPTALERHESVRSAQSALYNSATHQSSEKNELQPVPAGQAIPPATLVDVRRPSYTSSSKRQNVSSGISRRIQALEERSQRSSSPVSTTGHRSPSGLELPSSFTGQGQGQGQAHSRNMSLTSRPSSRASSRMGPTLNRFQPMDPIRDVALSSSPNVNTGKGSTFSLTARIVRPSVSKNEQSSGRALSPQKGSTFNRSQVIVDQPIGEGHGTTRNLTAKRGEPATPSTPARPSSRGSSVSEMKRASIDFGLKFMGRKKSENRSPTRPGIDKSSSVGSLETVEENQKNDATSPKAGSRTGRFFKRMSNLSNKSKRSPSEDGVSNFGEVESRQLATARPPPRASSYIVGDLNVQFPDSLFWKRRWVEVDGSGNLVLSPSQGKASRTPPKKYHLSSFDPPTMAGPDRQEMPHSIVLDFANGGNIQLASDDKISQGQVLKRLSEAHKAWTS